MGMDPSQCDPATIELFRAKFFGDSDKVSKQKKKERSRKANTKDDKLGEDEEALKLHHNEADIHMTKAKAKSRKTKQNNQDEGVIVENKGLDFADILEEIEAR